MNLDKLRFANGSIRTSELRLNMQKVGTFTSSGVSRPAASITLPWGCCVPEACSGLCKIQVRAFHTEGWRGQPRAELVAPQHWDVAFSLTSLIYLFIFSNFILFLNFT